MLKAKPAGPVVHLIPVRFDLASATVTLDYSTAALKPGDRVVWEFLGLPTGWSPWIEFRSGDTDRSFLGPFAALAQSATSLIGTCREEPDLVGKEFPYRISVQKGIGVGWESGMTVVNSSAGLLQINAADTGSGHRFTVRPSGDKLSVSPRKVTLGYGDTIEWVFEHIEGDPRTWRPMVNFIRYSGEGKVPNDYLGPFTVLETAAGLVRGMGNCHVGGVYHFQVSVVKVSTGEILWINSGDPVIDNRGGSPIEPPPTGGG